ncbi:hypothetical protein ACFLRT_04820 [Acidobacteriota bacterium]
MRKTSFVILFAILTVSLFAAKTIPLPELTNPSGVIVNNDQIYITQFPEIFIYSLKDFKLKKTFGKRGDRKQYEMLKDILQFPEYWRGIWGFMVLDKKIYVATHFKKDNRLEHFIFDIKGKLLNTVYVPRKDKGIRERLYPGTISHGILYQLIENKNLDGWLLWSQSLSQREI